MADHQALNRFVKIAGCLTLALLLAASLAGILLNDGGDPRTVESLQGGAVELFGGSGIYRYDTVTKAVFFDGINWVDLVFAAPLLAALLLAYPRGGLFVRLLLAALFTYIGYFFLIGVMGNAFNELFLVWTALFAAALFGLGAVLLDLDFRALSGRLNGRIPRRGTALYLFALGGMLLAQYLAEIIGAYASGTPPPSLAVYTTLELAAFELGLMVPLHFLGAVLLWKRHAAGYLLAAILSFAAAMAFVALSVGQILLVTLYHTGSAAAVGALMIPAAVACAVTISLFLKVRDQL
jgi:hypothetical protein